MHTSNLNLKIGKTATYNNKISIKNIDMKIGLDRNITKAEVYHEKFTHS